MSAPGADPLAAIRQPTLVEAARQIAGALTQARRSGDAEDVPEGVRYITISHTLAVEMARMLHSAIEAERLVECPTPVGCPCLMGTRHEWMFLHTQRESAIRALVAQWRENGKLFRTRAIAQLATGTTKGRIAADAYDASADAHFSMADAVERLLSGPQP